MFFHCYFSFNLTSWTNLCYALIETCDVIDGSSGDMTIKIEKKKEERFL